MLTCISGACGGTVDVCKYSMCLAFGIQSKNPVAPPHFQEHLAPKSRRHQRIVFCGKKHEQSCTFCKFSSWFRSSALYLDGGMWKGFSREPLATHSRPQVHLGSSADIYPLASLCITMERSTMIHNFSWENSRTFDWAIFNSYDSHHQRVYPRISRIVPLPSL